MYLSVREKAGKPAFFFIFFSSTPFGHPLLNNDRTSLEVCCYSPSELLDQKTHGLHLGISTLYVPFLK